MAGSRLGWKGIGLACLAGAMIPGGPYVYYPIAAVMLHNGAGLGVLVAFVVAKNLWSVSRLPLGDCSVGMGTYCDPFRGYPGHPPIDGQYHSGVFWAVFGNDPD